MCGWVCKAIHNSVCEVCVCDVYVLTLHTCVERDRK